MLSIKYQNEFERTIRKALPYLIFTEGKGFVNFKEHTLLVKDCQQLFLKLSDSLSEDKFTEINQRILDLIDSDKLINSINQKWISDYESIDSTHQTRFEKIEANIKKLESKAPIKRIKELETNADKLKMRIDELENQEKNNVEIPIGYNETPSGFDKTPTGFKDVAIDSNETVTGPTKISTGCKETPTGSNNTVTGSNKVPASSKNTPAASKDIKKKRHLSKKKLDMVSSLIKENPLYDKHDIARIIKINDKNVLYAFEELNFKPSREFIKAIFDSDIDNFTIKELMDRFKVKKNRCYRTVHVLCEEGKIIEDKSGKFYNYTKVK